MNNAIIARLCGLTVLISACILSFSIGNGCEENDEEITSVDYEPRAALIQVGGAAFNKANTKRWKQLGIKTPDELRKIGPSFLVRDFMGLDPKDPKKDIDDFNEGVVKLRDYPQFKDWMVDKFQPKKLACEGIESDADCQAVRVKNTSMILGRCAIGIYQVLLDHHGDPIEKTQADGTVLKWAEAEHGDFRLQLIHYFIADPQVQYKVSLAFCAELRTKYKGDPFQMASAYYSGSGIGKIFSKNWYKGMNFVKNVISLLKSFLPQGKFHSKRYYAKFVAGCYEERAGKKLVETDEDLVTFHSCVAKKETGLKEPLPETENEGDDDDNDSGKCPKGAKCD
jgi:hypothetical protein